MEVTTERGLTTVWLDEEIGVLPDDRGGDMEKQVHAAAKEQPLTDRPCCVGIDIGTTTVCAYVLRLDDGVPVGIFSIRNAADLPALFVGDKRQDADRLFDRVRHMLDAVLHRCPTVCAIGFTGQMHGMLCTDANGHALTPLYTWQDQRAAIGERSAAAVITEQTGHKVAAGYGLATFYTLLRADEIPDDTARICTVMDYAAARLCGKPVGIMHTTNAASLGLFDLSRGIFDVSALERLGIAPALLPRVTDAPEIIGMYRGIPVTVPIGDNQASFLGAVQDPGTTVLANFGTGSQISLLSPGSILGCSCGAVETRPFPGSRYLLSGAALCGGRAYAMLERFFRSFYIAAGGEDRELYETLNRLAGEELDSDSVMRLTVKTTFCGTRDDPEAAGAVLGIREAQFTPGALAAGVLRGMAEELHSMYETMPHTQITQLAASGNAIRRNPVLRRILSDVFGMPVSVPAAEEEAAFGAAMYAAVGAGYAANIADLGSWVRYQCG